MASIFISYRREDAEGYAGGRLYDQLSSHFGNTKVFMDVDTITIGEEFPDAIEQQLLQCDVLIAVVGPRWLEICGSDGTRRLIDPLDWVRHEIVTAIRRKIPLVPVLVGGALLPKGTDLPEEIREFTLHQAWEIGSQGFRQKVVQLITLLEKAIADGEKRRRQSELETRRANEEARIATYRANRFPLRPFQYPLWVLFFSGAIVMSAVASIVYFPKYLPAATALKAADEAYELGQINNAIKLYQRTLSIEDSSTNAKLGLAMALFKKGAPQCDKQALDTLSGLILHQHEWNKLLGAMPSKCTTYFKDVK